MAWPNSQDYNEAIQTPPSTLADPELKGGQPVLNAMGLPMPCSGNFADVYQFEGASGSKWAVKCFTREIPGLRERYVEISKYLDQVQLPFMVEFKFLEKGIRIRGQWYPVLKMNWVEGFTLNHFVRQQLEKPAILQTLCQIWVKMAARLRDARMAHCDLQHGNVLLVPGAKGATLNVRLVDYDGMCVPSLDLLKSIELGHPNFQHPQRLREGTYGVEVDRFSHLVIYTALRALTVGGKQLWEKFDNGDNLLFRQQDFETPARSPLFAELLRLKNPEIRELAGALIDASKKGLEQAPLLEELVPQPQTTVKAKGQTTTMAGETGQAPKVASMPGPAPESNPFADAFTDSEVAPARSKRQTARRPLWPWLAGGGGVVLLAALLIAFLIGQKNGNEQANIPNPPVGKGGKLPVDDKKSPPIKNKGNPPIETPEWDHLKLSAVEFKDDFLLIPPKGFVETKRAFDGPIEVTLLVRSSNKKVGLRANNCAFLFLQLPDTDGWHRLRFVLNEKENETSIDDRPGTKRKSPKSEFVQAPVRIYPYGLNGALDLKDLQVKPLETAIVQNPPSTEKKWDDLRLVGAEVKDDVLQFRQGGSLTTKKRYEGPVEIQLQVRSGNKKLFVTAFKIGFTIDLPNPDRWHSIRLVINEKNVEGWAGNTLLFQRAPPPKWKFFPDSILIPHNDKDSVLEIKSFAVKELAPPVQVVQGDANGLFVQGELDCAEKIHPIQVGPTFDTSKDWLLFFEFMPPKEETEATVFHLPTGMVLTISQNRLVGTLFANQSGFAIGSGPLPALAKWVPVCVHYRASAKESVFYVDGKMVQKISLGKAFQPKLNLPAQAVIGGLDEKIHRFKGKVRSLWLSNQGIEEMLALALNKNRKGGSNGPTEVANGLEIKDELDCAEKHHQFPIGPTFETGKDWLLFFEFLPPKEKQIASLFDVAGGKIALISWANGKLSLHVSDGKGGFGIDAGALPAEIRWLPVVARYRATAKELEVYLDGKLVKKQAVRADFNPNLQHPAHALIGGLNQKVNRFKGKVRSLWLGNQGIEEKLALALKVQPSDPIKDPPMETKGPIILKMDDQLTADDPKDKVTGNPHKRYKVELRAGKAYVIDMIKKNAGLDPLLRLEDADGKELAKDDDSGGNFNARIRFPCLRDDTYHIIATAFGKEVGPYSLTVRELIKEKPDKLPVVKKKQRLPVPTPKEIADAERKLRGTYAELYGKDDFASRQMLMDTLLNLARSAEEDPILLYVALSQGRDLAARNVNNRRVFEAFHRLQDAFEIDTLAHLNRIMEVALSAGKNAAVENIFLLGLKSLDEAKKADLFSTGKLTTLTRNAAVLFPKHPNSAVMLSALAGKEKVLKKMEEEYKKIKALLPPDAEDAKAQKAVGRYYAFIKEDWERGLPHLAQSGDAALLAVVEMDLKNPQDAQVQADLANAWRAYADKAAGESNLAKNNIRQRAKTWALRAFANLPNEDRAKVEDCLKIPYFGKNLKPGLVAEFFQGPKLIRKRIDQNLNFKNGFSNDDKIPQNGFAARWTGSMWVSEPGMYNISLQCTGTYSVKVDNNKVLSSTKIDNNTGTVRFLTEGLHQVEIQYQNLLGNANFNMTWSMWDRPQNEFQNVLYYHLPKK